MAEPPKIYPSLSVSESEKNSLQKAESDLLFYKLTQIEKELKHYKKLKKKWNVFKNILHYAKYPTAIVLLGGDIALAFTGIGIPVAIIGAGITIGELISVNVLEDTLVKNKIKNYDNHCKHLQSWIDKMYLFKADALRDGIIDQKEINQFKDMLTEYALSLEKKNSPQKEEKLTVKQELEKMKKDLQAMRERPKATSG